MVPLDPGTVIKAAQAALARMPALLGWRRRAVRRKVERAQAHERARLLAAPVAKGSLLEQAEPRRMAPLAASPVQLGRVRPAVPTEDPLATARPVPVQSLGLPPTSSRERRRL